MPLKIKKKPAFSLAEVLITLVILGVISAVLVPVMITNITDYCRKTSWQRAYNMLDQATSNIVTNNNGTLVGLFTSNGDIPDVYSNYFAYVKKCKLDASCWHPNNQWFSSSGSPCAWSYDAGFILNNGMLLGMFFKNTNCTNTDHSPLPICAIGYVDINGFKGPNTVSKDIFQVWITKDGLKPTGVQEDGYPCNASNKGGCGAVYLQQ